MRRRGKTLLGCALEGWRPAWIRIQLRDFFSHADLRETFTLNGGAHDPDKEQAIQAWLKERGTLC